MDPFFELDTFITSITKIRKTIANKPTPITTIKIKTTP